MKFLNRKDFGFCYFSTVAAVIILYFYQIQNPILQINEMI